MTRLTEVAPQTIDRQLQGREILLIDVREPAEHAAEHIAGALLLPLSSFDPASLPKTDGVEIVFHCAAGKRSAMAVARCLALGLAHTRHMTGGIHAWKQAGLPVVSPGRG